MPTFVEEKDLPKYLENTHFSVLPYLQRTTREIVSPFLCKCFSGSKKIVIFDTETNGLMQGISSILSISAKKYELDSECQLHEIGVFDRYYFAKEPEDEKAISVNGLTVEKLQTLREGSEYPRHEREDTAFQDFCNGVDSFIAYNLNFDVSWFPWIASQNTLCAMLSTIGLVREVSKYNGIKNSKLLTAVERLGIDVSDLSFHKSLDDVEATKRLIQKTFDIA